ncbi:hypothetical protein [Staphylococcus americanisciuri]|uniref:Uncharacterized protein n=1 Tax=Staphylococcus americanisciuri TaxID=2973940 RepID=A0ABT2EZL2_9STAP|nr:hypothetical protein [Staphylococcus americanisciuri]MCS4485643.1 hypothetical protein [Staphylococcus americanisciuri]
MSLITLFLIILLIILMLRFSFTLLKWVIKIGLFLFVLYLGYELFLWLVQWLQL